MKNPKLLVLACLVTLAAVGCQPQAPAEPEPAIAPAGAPADTAEAPKVDEVPPTDTSSTVAPRFDQRAFAGTFRGTLPCADCSGIDTTLELKPDGSYAISEIYKGKAGGAKMDGTWTAEANDKHIRLDPNSKSEADRLFAIASNEQIEQLGADGTPAASGTPNTLKREGAGR